jgi:hypothetical protein
VTFFCVAKRKSPKKRPPSIAPLRGSLGTSLCLALRAAFGCANRLSCRFVPVLLALCGGLSTGHPWPAKDGRHPCGARLTGTKLFAETGARARQSTLLVPGAAADSRTGRTAYRVASAPCGPDPQTTPVLGATEGRGVPDSTSVGEPPPVPRSAGYPRSWQVIGCLFFWFVFFGQAKKMNT